jgi:phosphoribosylformimino-5-aminoimidazole carboxamide ribotide isomerase
MELIPAIDLLGGRVVRLARGAYDEVTDYGDDPAEVARRFQAEGATRLHLVDLDAAREGRPQQAHVVARIVAAVDVPCQVAGGIRSASDAATALAAGADRIVLGSAFISHPALAGELVRRHGSGHIVSALDVRDGRALGDGWVASAREADVLRLASKLADSGIERFAVTAIARDGLMTGPDLGLLEMVASRLPDAAIIASGGIGSIADIRSLSAGGYEAAILGRALYEGAFSLSGALAAADRSSADRGQPA